MSYIVEKFDIKNRDADINCELFRVSSDRVIVFLHGMDDSRYGPSGIFKQVAEELADFGIASLFMDFRGPYDVNKAVSDIFAGLDHIDHSYGMDRIALVGWGIGGSAAIETAIRDLRVIMVVAIASDKVENEGLDLYVRPILLIHGIDDSKVSFQNTVDIAKRAKGTKQLILLPDGDHEISSYKQDMAKIIKEWIFKYL
jgi:dipeptidyl aminopeptidase/acylaminoacyl peptidase